ncbi:DUF3617 domain-containing protein [Nitrosomonas supralitoralis]|uniref:DUF3617 family protein n=1 Tax=Nitrosomonas supralitoralis TaxID=2116706 RepID=A0A2P7NXA9_9PROT|nr:DUF3617 family protein [Nitrosomonas supralitoralis]PSJ18098.1 hypothetical protein C7H79_04380 [Nitrosomonas supralitoralis]
MVLNVMFFLAFSTHAEKIRNGRWEVTTQTMIPGVQAQVPAHKDIVCVNDKHKDKPPIAVHESCQFYNYTITKNTATWQMKCDSDLMMAGAGRIVFSADKYTGSAIIKMRMPQSDPMEIDHTYTGRRIGDC